MMGLHALLNVYIMTWFWPLPVALNLIRSPVKVLSMIFYTAFGVITLLLKLGLSKKKNQTA